MEYDLKKPCKNCPFSLNEHRITFACRERAEEIAESAYRNGFPCHLSAVCLEETPYSDGGFVEGEGTQHCAGALMMFIADGLDEWPGVGNDGELVDLLREQLNFEGSHYFDSEEAFLEANTNKENGR